MDFAKLIMQLNKDPKIAMPRTVILWGCEDLLGKAVESLLMADRNWQVIKVPGQSDVRALTEEFEKTKPEIIIMNHEPCAEDIFTLIQITANLPQVKIISVNPDNNLVKVYNKQIVRIEEVSDLLAVLEKNSKSPAQGGENKP